MNILNSPKKVYFKSGCTPVALRELSEIYHFKKALLISDSHIFDLGIVTQISKLLQKQNIRTAEFFSLSPIPTFEDVHKALNQMEAFKPDVIIGIGGGAAMSAAKAVFLLSESPELDLNLAASKSLESKVPSNTKLVLMATSFGSGAQTSPLALLRNDQGKLCIINTPDILPEISITDADFTATLTSEQIKSDGYATLLLAIKIYSDENTSDYIRGCLEEASDTILKNLSPAMSGCPIAREHLHNAAAIAGSAYGHGNFKPDFFLSPFPPNENI